MYGAGKECKESGGDGKGGNGRLELNWDMNGIGKRQVIVSYLEEVISFPLLC